MTKVFKILDSEISIANLFESMPVAMVLIDREGRHIVLNQALASISGKMVDELVGTKVSDLSKESGENIVRDFQRFDQGEEVPNHEVIIGDKIFHVSVKALRNERGMAIGELVALTDITRVKETEKQLALAHKQLAYLARYDSLTGLLNAKSFHQMSDNIMNHFRIKQYDYSVLFLDLDHFKKVNDTYGHAMGDKVLVSVAECFRENSREGDIVGRIGGEEFSIFLPKVNQKNALVVAEKIRKSIEAILIKEGDIEIRVTVSIGVASNLVHHESFSDLLRDADHAMYHAKKGGRNRVSSLTMPCYYNEDHGVDREIY